MLLYIVEIMSNESMKYMNYLEDEKCINNINWVKISLKSL